MKGIRNGNTTSAGIANTTITGTATAPISPPATPSTAWLGRSGELLPLIEVEYFLLDIVKIW